MCVAVKYHFDGKNYTVYFSHPNARLPVLTRSSQPQLIIWGRRKNEPSLFYFGGWARHHNIQRGSWDKFHPKPIKLAITHFAERDVMGNELWFEVTTGQYLQGALVQHKHEVRVYVITLETHPEEMHFERWPRIVSAV